VYTKVVQDDCISHFKPLVFLKYVFSKEINLVNTVEVTVYT